MSKITIAEIEAAVAVAEAEIAKYAAARRALLAGARAGNISYPAANRALLQAARPIIAARRALDALGSREIDGTPSEALMARCDAVDGWHE